MKTLPTLEARLWWATRGTCCVVVAAVTEEDAQVLADARFADVGIRYAAKVRVEPATPEQYERYQRAMEQTLVFERMRREAAAS